MKRETIQEAIVRIFINKAQRHDNWLDFWADCLRHASGNVKGLMTAFEMAGVSTKDIQKAHKQLRML